MTDEQWKYVKASLGAIRGSLGWVCFLLVILILTIWLK